MSYTYADRRRTPSAPAKQNTDALSPAAEALRAGAAAPTQEQMGRRVDLPDAMRAKMEESFGADLSAVKLYESQSVSDAGAEAVTQGSNIAFAPGMLDFSSFGGQALLGHEISHVVSQARGEVTGGGFLNDHALEARADREGAMAAAGQQIAAPTAALSPVSATAAAGPMQAKKENKEEKAQQMAKAAQDDQISNLSQMIKMRRKHGDDVVESKKYKALDKAWKKARKKEAKGRRNMSNVANVNLTSTDILMLANIRGKYGEHDDYGDRYDDLEQMMSIFDENGGIAEGYGSPEMMQQLKSASDADREHSLQMVSMYKQLAAEQANMPASPMQSELMENFMTKSNQNSMKAKKASKFQENWGLADADMSLDPRITDPETVQKLRSDPRLHRELYGRGWF